MTNFVQYNNKFKTDMYDTLLQLPLFQGLTKDDFNSLLMKLKLNFTKYQAGSTFINAGDACTDFVFLISGSVVSTRESKSSGFLMREVFEAPYLLEPFSMFGVSATYNHSYMAQTDTSALLIDKQYIYTELNKYSICGMNMLNMLSRKAQAVDAFIWSRKPFTLREQIIRFIRGLCELQTGEKYLQIKMNTLADLMNTTRLKISNELNDMAELGLIVLKRKEIYIPNLTKLIESAL